MTFSALRELVGEWFARSANRRILAAALTVGSFTVVVKLAAMTKELVVAYRFGTGDAIDAFLIAFLVPALAVNVVTGSMGLAVAPLYVELRERLGAPAAVEFFRSAMAVGLVVVLAASAAMFFVLPALPLLASGFGPEKLALTRTLFLLLLPVLALNALISLWSTILNCEGRFAWAAVAPVCVPVATLAAVIVAPQHLGGEALAVGTTVGYVLQCGGLAVALARLRVPLLPRWRAPSNELRRAWRQYVPVMASAVLTSGSWAIGQAMAATLPAGSVAALGYANKIPAVASEIGSMAVATAVLPHFALMVARREWSGIWHTLNVYSRLILAVTVPLTLLAVWLSPTIVRVLFQRGEFTATDTATVATVQGFFLLQIPFAMVGMLFVRLASSLQRNSIFLAGALISLPLNVVLNAVFMRRLGVAGVALSTATVSLVSCVYLWRITGRALRASERQRGASASS